MAKHNRRYKDSVFVDFFGEDYEGFTYNSALTMVNGAIQASGPIAADGSTVIKLYYERNTVNVTFKLAGGNISGSSVYVAAGNLWKVDGAAATPITVSGAKGLYALCVREGIVYAAGWTDASFPSNPKAAVWKIEGTNVSLYKELSTDYSGVYALCAGRDDLYAAGFYYDTDNKYKPVWWHIAEDGTLTEHKRGIDKGAARGICVAPQE